MKDSELQLALAKMLPEKLIVWDNGGDIRLAGRESVNWREEGLMRQVRETEWLHVCWLIEQELKKQQKHFSFSYYLYNEVVPTGEQPCSASWQQRAAALIAVKGEK